MLFINYFVVFIESILFLERLNVKKAKNT